MVMQMKDRLENYTCVRKEEGKEKQQLPEQSQQPPDLVFTFAQENPGQSPDIVL